MTFPDNGNPNPPNNAQAGERDPEVCPYCDAKVKFLAFHLPECDKT